LSSLVPCRGWAGWARAADGRPAGWIPGEPAQLVVERTPDGVYLGGHAVQAGGGVGYERQQAVREGDRPIGLLAVVAVARPRLCPIGARRVLGGPPGLDNDRAGLAADVEVAAAGVLVNLPDDLVGVPAGVAQDAGGFRTGALLVGIRVIPVVAEPVA
jgi:hypothetical protein